MEKTKIDLRRDTSNVIPANLKTNVGAVVIDILQMLDNLLQEDPNYLLLPVSQVNEDYTIGLTNLFKEVTENLDSPLIKDYTDLFSNSPYHRKRDTLYVGQKVKEGNTLGIKEVEKPKLYIPGYSLLNYVQLLSIADKYLALTLKPGVYPKYRILLKLVSLEVTEYVIPSKLDYKWTFTVNSRILWKKLAMNEEQLLKYILPLFQIYNYLATATMSVPDTFRIRLISHGPKELPLILAKYSIPFNQPLEDAE